MCFKRWFIKRKGYKLKEVFTPTVSAEVAYLSRADIEKQLDKAIDIPGKQVVIFGHSGSGKTTLLKHIITKKELKVITTSCTTSSTLESIILDAFDQLNPYYVCGKKEYEKLGITEGLSVEYAGIKGKINTTIETGEETSKCRMLPPQLTEQRLCQFISSANLIWVIEDFHKVAEEEKTKISQMMKLFMDRTPTDKNTKIVVLGAAEHGYEVCKYDNELNNRITEVEVPLLTKDEIKNVIKIGCEAMNIDLSDELISEIAKYSNCLATIAHQLAYNICYNNDVLITQKKLKKIDDEELNKAIEDFTSEKQDTYNKLYLEITKHNKSKFTNVELILDALSTLEDNVLHHEVYDYIVKNHPNYPQGNASAYLAKLCTPTLSEVLRNTGGRYSFSDPFFKSYVRMRHAKK